jgi:putative ABC transport system permease protein
MIDPTRLYSWLLALYPARFREEYRGPMEQQFRDDYREARGPQRLRLWWAALHDLAATAPGEIARELARDLKYSSRLYRRRSISAIFAVTALGLAIGTSTAVFSVMNALLLRSLPFEKPEQLVEVGRSPVGGFQGRKVFGDWRAQNPSLRDAALFSSAEMSLSGKQGASRVKVTETSANFLQLLGAQPSAGRFFDATEDVPGQNTVAVIGHGLWQQWFGGDPGVAGAVIHVNGASLTVIGVAPPRFDYPGKTMIWTPTVFDVERVPKRAGATFYFTIGRLKNGLSIRQAQRFIEATDTRPPQDRAILVSLREQLAGSVGEASWMLAALVLLVLLTACANVAHLLLSRTAERRTELAVRAALGASRARLVQQLITEAVILTAAGSLLGLFVARWALQAVTAVVPAQLTSQAYTVLDLRVLGFAGGLALGTGVVFGVLPAWFVGRLLPAGDVMRSRTSVGELGTRRVRRGLVALQVALTLTLVASSVAMGRTMLRLLSTELGFSTRNVATVNVSLQGTKYRKASAQWQYYREALDGIRRTPGVESAGAVSYLPLAARSYTLNLVSLDSGESVSANLNAATPGYFRAIGTKLIAGRDFEEGDGTRSSPAAIVDETFVSEARMGDHLMGRQIKLGWTKQLYTVVGIVEAARFMGPTYNRPIAQIFFPMEEDPPPAVTFVAKGTRDSDAMLARCAAVVRAIDREVPVYDVKTLDQRLAEILARPRFFTTAIVFLAGLAVLVACVGIYGAAAYSVAQRRQEMGLRLALGASAHRVRAMVVRESISPLVAGMVLGVGGALAVGRYLNYLVYDAQPVDEWTCAAGAGLLLIGGVLAAWNATTHIPGIAPADALRAE